MSDAPSRTDHRPSRSTARRRRAFVTTAADGALVVFEGVVRDHDHGASVHALDYEAHPDARALPRRRLRRGRRCVGPARRGDPPIGALSVGDVALVAAVAAPHRAEAFAVCAQLVDLVKERTPIWKRQHLAEGTTEWVGL